MNGIAIATTLSKHLLVLASSTLSSSARVNVNTSRSYRHCSFLVSKSHFRVIKASASASQFQSPFQLAFAKSSTLSTTSSSIPFNYHPFFQFESLHNREFSSVSAEKASSFPPSSLSSKSFDSEESKVSSIDDPDKIETTQDVMTSNIIDSNDSNSNKQSIHVVSYNLLSSHLAEPTFHTKCKPEYLEAKNRFPKIVAKLQNEIDKHSNVGGGSGRVTPVVFCLQEVSHTWAKKLHVFFAENGYHFITALYGNYYSDYMGIGIAYPIQQFKTIDVDICKLSDTRVGGWPKPREGIDDVDNNKEWLVKKYVFNPLLSTVKYLGLLQDYAKPKITDPWEKSQYRHNEFIAVQLQQRMTSNDNKHSESTINTSSIWIGNYHMPCAFRDPAVMTIHCDLVARRIQYLAAKSGNPFVLAGDFNILPDSPQYKFLTAGILSSSSYPPIKYGVTWEASCTKMKSAYALYNKDGLESDFTNYAHNGALSDESFIGTLDYIFLSDDHEWNVKEVVQLKHRDDVEDGPFPNKDEPSDHVLIAATLEV